MKKLVLVSLFILGISPVNFAQTAQGFGFKGGLNYNANGNYVESIGANAEHPDRNIGFHLGVFGKIGNKFYLKPELVYTSTKSDYDNDSFNMQKLDLPVLFGDKVLGPISVFGGRFFQYFLDSELDGVTINVMKNDITVGLNFVIAI